MNPIPILYENEEIYVINKPAGLAVQGGNGISQSLDKNLCEQLNQKVFLVHRLDRGTSGLMIVAKNSKSASKWTREISEGNVIKTYTAICFGKMQKKSGTISDDVIQHGVKKHAITNYKVVDEKKIMLGDSEVDVSKISLTLKTGRMHQIRIQLAKNGCFIIGDETHGNFPLNRLAKKELKIKNLQLFSVRLELPSIKKNFDISDTFAFLRF